MTGPTPCQPARRRHLMYPGTTGSRRFQNSSLVSHPYASAKEVREAVDLLSNLPQEGWPERGKRLQANLKVPSRPRKLPCPCRHPIDQQDRRNPALVAEDPGRKSGRYQMLARAEVECVAVEVRQQPNRFDGGGLLGLRGVLRQHPSGLAFDSDFDNLARQRSQHPFGLASPGSATPPERKIAICSRPIGAQVPAADCLQGYIAIQIIKPAPCSQPLIRSNESDVLTAAGAEAPIALIGWTL